MGYPPTLRPKIGPRGPFGCLLPLCDDHKEAVLGGQLFEVHEINPIDIKYVDTEYVGDYCHACTKPHYFKDTRS